jgi:hypothetical protein
VLVGDLESFTVSTTIAAQTRRFAHGIGHDRFTMTSETDAAGPANETAAAEHEPDSTSRPVRYATGADWAAHKTEIQRLYMEDELPLKEVMHIMREKHSFNATYGSYLSTPPRPKSIHRMGVTAKIANSGPSRTKRDSNHGDVGRTSHSGAA